MAAASRRSVRSHLDPGRRSSTSGGGADGDVGPPLGERLGHNGQHPRQGVGVEMGATPQQVAVRREEGGGRPPVQGVPRADVGPALGVDPHRQEPVGHEPHDARVAEAESVHLRRPPAPRGADEQQYRLLLRRGAGEGVGSPVEPGNRFRRFRRRHHAVRADTSRPPQPSPEPLFAIAFVSRSR
jgi:hypothetical protein